MKAELSQSHLNLIENSLINVYHLGEECYISPRRRAVGQSFTQSVELVT